MGAVDPTFETVESQLETLGETYESFSVNQTTLAVGSERYEEALNQDADTNIEVYTKVENEDAEILYLTNGDTSVLPSETAASVADVETAAEEAVEGTVGIDCSVRDLESATILGIRDADDESRETVYSLVVVFRAKHVDGAINGDVQWRQGFNKDRLFA